MPKNKKWFWLVALVAAWLLDFLFWKKPAGVSFLIWTVILLAGGYVLAWREQKKPAKLSIVLTLMAVLFAAVSVFRNEPLTRAISVMITFGTLLLLAATFTNGHWPFYRLWDYVSEFARVIWSGISGAITINSSLRTPPPLEGQGPEKLSAWKKIFPVIRGILIALPILAVLGVLLSAADPVFGDWMKKILDIEKLPEYLFRLFYIVLVGAILVGVYLHAVASKREVRRPNPNEAWMKPFLGWTETGIILGAVNVLFITFVIIQIRYLFGGEVNISETGYTYAEYARRGFGELVAVAVLSMLLYLGLNTIAKRDSRTQKAGFTILSVLLMVNVLVLLGSSLQRLFLYETAYGFSQLRMHTHLFIYWLAGLIVATMVLEIIRKRGHFALALLVCVIGFGATFAIVNIDGFIVNKNVDRAIGGEKLDLYYLNSLSADAVPVLFERYQEPGIPNEIKDGLGTVLACTEKVMGEMPVRPWQGFNIGQANAYRLLQEESSAWSQYQPYQDERGNWVIQYQGEEFSCYSYTSMD